MYPPIHAKEFGAGAGRADSTGLSLRTGVLICKKGGGGPCSSGRKFSNCSRTGRGRGESSGWGPSLCGDCRVGLTGVRGRGCRGWGRMDAGKSGGELSKRSRAGVCLAGPQAHNTQTRTNIPWVSKVMYKGEGPRNCSDDRGGVGMGPALGGQGEVGRDLLSELWRRVVRIWGGA
eukprot:767506-Hanusia_phi.AAC.1